MQQVDKAKFVAVLTTLCATFRETSDEGLLDGYWMGLEDLPIESVKAACARAVGECVHMPRPAEIRRLAGADTSADGVQSAWGEVVRQVASVGSYGKPEFAPDVREAVVACGGWSRLCAATTEQLHSWIKREFEEHLEAQRRRKNATPPSLTAPPAPCKVLMLAPSGDDDESGDDE